MILNTRYLLFIIAILGLLVSGYLFATYVLGGPIICDGSGGCEIVRASEYSTMFGLPTPTYGLLFYLVLALGALLATPERAGQLHLPLVLVTGLGAAVSVYLTYIEAFVIEAWCLWCVISALLSFLAWGVVWFGPGRRSLFAD